ncbi:MAG: nitrate transporter ATP-binding protein [Blastococcus sp.]|nr:nitrate transporter ATP-binding protein [Blastococcus sp.]
MTVSSATGGVETRGATDSRPYIDVRDVGMSFASKSDDVIIIDGLSFTVADGEFCSIVGPSGCGKSTALRIIDGLTPPTSGEVRVGARTVTGPSLDVGFVFQQYNLLPWRTVAGNVALSLESIGTPKKDRPGKAREWLDVVGLGHVADYYPSQISGGMQQRVGLARALALEPRVLLMDEPFGAVDAQTRLLMQEQLLQIWEQRACTVVFVTHDIEEALYLSDRVLVMAAKPGRMVADIEVSFPRPRAMSVRSDPGFVRMKDEIWDLLHPGHGA